MNDLMNPSDMFTHCVLILCSHLQLPAVVLDELPVGEEELTAHVGGTERRRAPEPLKLRDLGGWWRGKCGSSAHVRGMSGGGCILGGVLP